MICRLCRRHRSWLFLLMALWLLIRSPLPAMAGEDEVYVAIHQRSHLLQIVLNDTAVYSFPVATGRRELTPVGQFTIVTKVYKPFYLSKQIAGGDPKNPLGTRWLGLNIGNGYKYGIHGTNRPWSIGSSVSSGCIRMRNKDVEFVYRHIPLRTRVVIDDE